jgi:ABC-type branched-subunit amino acid transport system substrate-binding protein
MRGLLFPIRGRRRSVGAALVVSAIVSAACSSGELADPVASMVDPASPVATSDAGSNPSTDRPGPAAEEHTSDDDDAETMADLEATWSAERGQMIASLTVPNFGLGDDDVLTGPGAFEVNLGRCPSEWDDRSGVEDDTIRIAMVAPQNGPFASFADIALGVQLYAEYVNENGGIDGRSIELVVGDDSYEPELTGEAVASLLASDEEPLYVTTIGSPTSLAVSDELNQACVPQPFVVSDHPGLGDPASHPFTTGFQLARSTEAVLWGRWIKDNLPGMVPVKVGALVIDNDFGQIYADAFQAWAEANRDVVAELVLVSHDPSALSVASEMEELAESRPDVFLSMTAGQPCRSAIAEAERTGLTRTAVGLFTPAGCRQPSTYLEPVGSAGHGFWIVGGGAKSLTDPAFAGETFVDFANAELRDAGIDPERHLVGVGFAQYGWAHVELLRVASALPGGLSRSNVVLAQRSLDLSHPILFDGVRLATAGDRDAFPVEGSVYSRYDADSASWFVQGAAVDVDGGTPNCTLVGLVCQQ